MNRRTPKSLSANTCIIQRVMRALSTAYKNVLGTEKDESCDSFNCQVELLDRYLVVGGDPAVKA